MPASASAAPQRRRLLVMAAGAAACAACAAGDGGGAPGVFDIHLPPPTVLVSLESELIGHPTDIDVDASGRVWVADSRNRRLLVVDPAGGEPRLIGREGEGPGEFRAPARLAIADTLVHVVDAGNARVQQYRLDGTHVADHLIGDPMIGGGAVSRDGDVVAPTLGRDSALARVHALRDAPGRFIGAPIVTPAPWNFTAMKAEIAQGRVPDQFRNAVTPVFGADGTVWLLVQTEAEVRRYDADGRLVWSRVLDVPEIEEARREFFRRNAEEERPSVIVPLYTMVAAREVGDKLWVLMQAAEESREAVFYILDRETGDMLGRLSVDVPAAVNRFAVDTVRSRLYLAVPAEAALLAVDGTRGLQP